MPIEDIARAQCIRLGIDPDQKTTAIRPKTLEVFPNGYKLWEYQAHFYVRPIIQDYLQNV